MRERRPDEKLTAAEEELVASSKVMPRVVAAIAGRAKRYDLAELTSIGYLSLRRAAKNFRPELGTPFDGYAYRFVHLDLLRFISDEHAHQQRERASSFDAAYDHLERARDPGDLWNDSPADARRHVAELAASVLVTISARVLSDASLAPSEEDIERHLDWQRRRRRFWDAVAALGERGRVIVLRYMEGLEWDSVAAAMGVSNASIRREHDEVVALLAARLRPLR